MSRSVPPFPLPRRVLWLLRAAMLALAVGCGSGGGGGGGSGEGAPTLGRLPGLSGPMGIAIVPVAMGGKARVVVLEEQTGELSRADLDTGEIELIAKGLSSPFAMMMEPEAGSATALVTEANRLSRVDLTTGRITPLAAFANRPTGLAIDPAQPDTVWVAEAGTGDLYRVRRSDGYTQQVIHQPGLARARGLAFEQPGVLLVAEGDTANGGIVRVDLRPSQPTFTTIIAGRAELRLPFGLDLGTVGNFAYVTAQAANQLARVDNVTSGATLQTHIDALKGPTGLARLPDGRLVVAQHSTNDLVVLDPDCATIPCQAPPPAVAGLGTPGDLVLEGPDTALVLEQNGLDTVPNAGALSRINTKTGKVTEIASGLATPEALVLADRTVYVAEAGAIPNTLSGIIRQISLDPGAPTVLPTAPLYFPSGMALADPSTLVIVERTGSLVRVTLPGGASTRPPLDIGMGNPVGIATAQAADGVHAYVTDAFAGTLLKVRNVATCNPCSPEPIATNLPNPSGVAIEPSGASALVVTDTGPPAGGAIVRVFLQGAVTPTPSTIVKGLTNPRRIAIEPGGATALITENDPDGVRRVALPAP